MNAAMTCFARQGMERAGHGDIAKLAGVSTATVFNYFPTRAELVSAVMADITDIVELMFAGLRASPDFNAMSPKHRVLRLEHALAVLTETKPDMVKTFLNWSVTFNPELRAPYLGLQKSVIAHLQNFLPEGPSNFDNAQLLFGTTNMITSMRFDNVDDVTIESFVNRMADMLCET